MSSPCPVFFSFSCVRKPSIDTTLGHFAPAARQILQALNEKTGDKADRCTPLLCLAPQPSGVSPLECKRSSLQ